MNVDPLRPPETDEEPWEPEPDDHDLPPWAGWLPVILVFASALLVVLWRVNRG